MVGVYDTPDFCSMGFVEVEVEEDASRSTQSVGSRVGRVRMFTAGGFESRLTTCLSQGLAALPELHTEPRRSAGTNALLLGSIRSPLIFCATSAQFRHSSASCPHSPPTSPLSLSLSLSLSHHQRLLIPSQPSIHLTKLQQSVNVSQSAHLGG